jgi:hypothetical protein
VLLEVEAVKYAELQLARAGASAALAFPESAASLASLEATQGAAANPPGRSSLPFLQPFTAMESLTNASGKT